MKREINPGGVFRGWLVFRDVAFNQLNQNIFLALSRGSL